MIVGTAGHVDHGKTRLVAALTGIDTDRLKEEKERGISIALGFAYVPLADGSMLGFVDVPGHERFVQTMLAGAGGIDFFVLVVAADEGIKPQTVEHLDILDLLGVHAGVVALTKTDAVEQGRAEIVAKDARALLAARRFPPADVYPVSALTGAGIAELKERLAEEALSRPPPAAGGVFRLSIDRSFTLKGAGTVVAGTVLASDIAVGDRVVVLPHGLEARVRSLHAGNRSAGRAQARERAAFNLAGPDIGSDAVHRGDWLVAPDARSVTDRFDADVRLLADAPRAIRTWSPAVLHLGASALPCRMVVLDGDGLAPGDGAAVQIVLPRALPVRHGDRFVLRDSAARRTIGGGRVLDPRAPARHRRTPLRFATLDALRNPDAASALAALIGLWPHIVDLAAFAADRGLGADEASAAAAGFAAIESRTGTFVTSEAAIADMGAAIAERLAAFHAAEPARGGLPAERVRLALSARCPRGPFEAFVQALTERGVVAAEAGNLRLPGHAVSLAAAEARLWDRIRPLLERDPFHPPTARDMGLALGFPVARVRALLKTLARMGQVSEVAADRFLLAGALAELIAAANALAGSSPGNAFTVIQFKDRVCCGRNVAIQILEHFDRRGITLRKGDVRVMGRRAGDALPAATKMA
jgi:selenocysteine-specific elongation factor